MENAFNFDLICVNHNITIIIRFMCKIDYVRTHKNHKLHVSDSNFIRDKSIVGVVICVLHMLLYTTHIAPLWGETQTIGIRISKYVYYKRNAYIYYVVHWSEQNSHVGSSRDDYIFIWSDSLILFSRKNEYVVWCGVVWCV